MQHGLMASIAVPMNLAKSANAIWPLLEELADVCNINCKCDLQVRLKGHDNLNVNKIHVTNLVNFTF